jgi:hypothetical protein
MNSFSKNVIGQGFAAGEAERLYRLLDEIGCIGNVACGYSDFTVGKTCRYKYSANKYDMKCSNGFLNEL